MNVGAAVKPPASLFFGVFLADYRPPLQNNANCVTSTKTFARHRALDEPEKMSYSDSQGQGLNLLAKLTWEVTEHGDSKMVGGI